MSERNSALFDSEAGFRQALDTVIAAATREIRVFDRDLSKMRLEEKSRAEALENFLAADRERHLHVVLHDPEAVERNCPRLMALRRRFSMTVEFRRSPDELRHLTDAFLLADHAQGAVRFHFDHARGRLLLDTREDVHPFWQRFDDLWELSMPCISATRLGL